MLAYLRKVMRQTKDRGASAVEYGLLVAAIAAVIVGAVFALGGQVSTAFTHTSGCLKAGASAAPDGSWTCPPTP
ncbi:MAG TPA: Flp family type IVb pilin [Kineosporiaceae bacterium]|jgi:pilus assembly protein Flp/PilA|nr:Flp family type IVb pilin [Kineosporiaceae bacterium]